MIKALTAHTTEIDDVQAAVDEILAQLDLEHALLQNAVGILACYSEFIDSGVVAALQKRLPFDLVGTTTLSSATNGDLGELMLALTVLTADDVRFSTSVSVSLLEEQAKPLSDVYHDALNKLGEAPVMMIAFQSLLQTVGGDEVVETLDMVSGGVPLFGTLAVDHTSDYHTAQIIYRTNGYRDAVALILIAGNVQPHFAIGSIEKSKVRRQQAIITASNRSVLQEVNNVPVLQYMKSLGLAKNNEIEGISSIPFVIDYNDGTEPVTRAIFALTPEGYAICGGNIPIGATLSIGAIDHGDVVSTTTKTLQSVLDTGHGSLLLMFSCIGRNLALGVESRAELELVREALDGKMPYLFCYSGGEICPVYDADGKAVNRFHNDTIVACIL